MSSSSSSIALKSWNGKKQRTQLSAGKQAPVDLEAADALLLLAQGAPRIAVERRDEADPRITKVLKQSNLGELSRVLLPKASTENFLSSVSRDIADECKSRKGREFKRTQLSASKGAPVDLEAAATAVKRRDQAAPRITKLVLKPSDLGELSRVLLPKASTEIFLSSINSVIADECKSPKGRVLEVYDPEDGSSHRMTLKQQPSTRSFVLQWAKSSVEKMRLNPGDGIELKLDGSRFIITKLKNNA